MSRLAAWVVAVVPALGCERAPPPAPTPAPKGAVGLPEVKRAKQDAEAAQQRTDDAVDRAMHGEQVEQVERGTPTR